MSFALLLIARCISFVAGLFFLATIVALASHASPIVIHGGEKPEVWGASWNLIATLGGIGVGLLAISAVLGLLSAFVSRNDPWDPNDYF